MCAGGGNSYITVLSVEIYLESHVETKGSIVQHTVYTHTGTLTETHSIVKRTLNNRSKSSTCDKQDRSGKITTRVLVLLGVIVVVLVLVIIQRNYY